VSLENEKKKKKNSKKNPRWNFFWPACIPIAASLAPNARAFFPARLCSIIDDGVQPRVFLSSKKKLHWAAPHPAHTVLAAAAAAADASVQSFQKNALPQLELLECAARFDVHTPPVALLAYNAAFFGISAAAFGNAIVTEYRAYINEHGTRPPAEWATTSNDAYWTSKQLVWPALSRAALRWAQVPMSSIAAERVFGQARVVDAPQRQSQL
jgi:hypothetical protein